MVIWFFAIISLCIAPWASASQRIAPDHSAITVRGCRYISKQEDGSLRFNRFDPAIGRLSAKAIGFNWQKAQATTGVRLFFKTNSPRLTLFFRMNPKDRNRGADFGVLIDGKFQKGYEFWKSHGNELKVEIDSGSSRMKSYEVTLPSFSNPQFVGMTIAEGSNMEEVPNQQKKIYVAMGDSITHGQGQGSATYKTYPYLLAKKLDVDFYNLAVGGGKISLPVAQQLKDWQKIDLMTVLIGYNDWCFNGKTVEQYKKDYRKFLRIIRTNHPETPIYCITMLFTKTETSKKSGLPLPPYRKAIEDLIAELQKVGDKNMHLIKGPEISSVINLQADKPDPVHLSVKGASLLAEELHQVIKRQ